MSAQQRKNWTREAAGRAIKYAGVLGGLPREEINSLLASVGLPELPPPSFKMISRNEAALFRVDLAQLGAFIRSPKSAGEITNLLKNRGEPAT